MAGDELVRAGRDLTVNRGTVATFVLITAPGITRVTASWHLGEMMILLGVSAACEIGVRLV
jgi:hypothetical protein